jgi:2-keto-4-pentenoate hydratase/2-oxohepta-3-ene-1,7-dioic acid hydratase in catechol pathway
MKLCRFDDDRLGLVRDETVIDVSAALSVLPAVRWPLPQHDPLVARLDSLRPGITSRALRGAVLPLAGRMLRSPVASPGKIVAVRRNYGTGPDGPPDFFLKAVSSLAGPGDGILLPMPDRPCQVEIELAAVIGTTGRGIPREEAPGHVAGYCVALDASLVGDEDRGLRKSPDSFCVLGPWLTTADEVPDLTNLGISLEVDGRPAQQGSTHRMLRDTASLVAAASACFTLHPGDILLTGAPAGPSLLARGQHLGCRVERLGAMTVVVR